MRHSLASSFIPAACLALAVAATAQNDRKVPAPQPAPQHDLDGKWTPVQPVVATSPKSDVQGTARPANQQPEPLKGSDTVVLPNGRPFHAGIPHDQVVFDNAGDAIWIEGDGYKASLSNSGLTFIPYFGATAPQNYPVALTLENAQLGATVPVLADAAPSRQGNIVSLNHGAVRETFDVGLRAVEQKFVIAKPFAGDLVLTLRVATELQAQRDNEGWRFGNALGHVGYSNAVLVDASGRRTAMTTEYENGHITLRAPAAALEGAQFPVTVDPTLTAFTAQASTTFVLTNADVAFSATSGNYLVSWTRVFSATDTDLHCIFVDNTGTVVAGSLTLLDNTTDRWDDGRVAVCGSNFMGVASRTPSGGGQAEIWGRTRDINSTTMGAQFQISESSFTGNKVNPDVGGEFDGPVNFGVVWQRNFTATDHDIHYRIVTGATGVPNGVTRIIDNSGANDDFRPRMSKCDGRLPASEQVWIVCWQRLIGGTQHDIYGARVLWDGTLSTAPFAIDTAVSDNDRQPSPTSLTASIGGNKYWLVAFTTNNTGDLDIYLRCFRDGASPVNISSNFLANLEGITAAQRTRDQFLPQSDGCDARFAVSYVEAFSATDHDAYVSTLQLAPGLTAVDPRVTLTFSGLDTQSVGVVANRSGGGENNFYGAVYDHNSQTAPINSSINGFTYLGVTPGGGFSNRSTSCGSLTMTHTGVPAIGETVTFSLNNAHPLTGVVFGTPQPGAPIPIAGCGSCLIGVNGSAVIANPINVNVPLNVNLVGSTFSIQGFTFGGGPCLGSISVSDTTDITVR